MDGKQLEKIMKEQKISVKDLVSKLGISSALIYKWIDGTRVIPRWLPLALRGAGYVISSPV